MKRRHPLSTDELDHKRAQLAPYLAAYDLLNVPIRITDENGVILYANAADEQMTGYGLSEMLGRTAGDLWGGNEPPEFYRELWNTVKVRKQAFHGVVHNRYKDSREMTQIMYIAPLVDGLNDARFFIAAQVTWPDAEAIERTDQ
jgi:PAS domain S-box-containing protein